MPIRRLDVKVTGGLQCSFEDLDSETTILQLKALVNARLGTSVRSDQMTAIYAGRAVKDAMRLRDLHISYFGTMMMMLGG